MQKTRIDDEAAFYQSHKETFFLFLFIFIFVTIYNEY